MVFSSLLIPAAFVAGISESHVERAWDVYETVKGLELAPLERRNESWNFALVEEVMPRHIEALRELAEGAVQPELTFLYGDALLHAARVGRALDCPREFRGDVCSIYRDVLREDHGPRLEQLEQRGRTLLRAVAQEDDGPWSRRAERILGPEG